MALWFTNSQSNCILLNYLKADKSLFSMKCICDWNISSVYIRNCQESCTREFIRNFRQAKCWKDKCHLGNQKCNPYNVHLRGLFTRNYQWTANIYMSLNLYMLSIWREGKSQTLCLKKIFWNTGNEGGKFTPTGSWTQAEDWHHRKWTPGQWLAFCLTAINVSMKKNHHYFLLLWFDRDEHA